MSEPQSPEQLFMQGQRDLPAWNDEGPDADARYAAAVALITRAAEAGHWDAARLLADGMAGEASWGWALRLAAVGDWGRLVSAMTDGDEPVERPLSVLVAARAGEPWAQIALAGVYGLGMVGPDGELLARRDGAYGWLPGVDDPKAEALIWRTRAAEAGWPPAQVRLAEDLIRSDPARALGLLRAALGVPDGLLPVVRERAAGLEVRLLDELGAELTERRAAWQRLAEAGDGDALVRLGDLARLGALEAPDLAAARALYERAVAFGSVDGYRELGRCCEEGLGGPVDLDRARALYESAAELGADAFSRDRLAERFGLEWYRRAPGE